MSSFLTYVVETLDFSGDKLFLLCHVDTALGDGCEENKRESFDDVFSFVFLCFVS